MGAAHGPRENLLRWHEAQVEIACGFLHTPKILFLDEPTLGLDPQSRNQLWTHVKGLNERENTTVFLTTHYMDEADRVAHRIAVMDHGAIVAIGTSNELKAKDQHSITRKRLPRVDRNVDPRRSRQLRGCNAPVCTMRQEAIDSGRASSGRSGPAHEQDNGRSPAF